MVDVALRVWGCCKCDVWIGFSKKCCALWLRLQETGYMVTQYILKVGLKLHSCH